MKPFMNADFLLPDASAQRLYHEYAASMPIIDYHCHLPPADIAGDTRFENRAQVWLGGDHYKWREWHRRNRRTADPRPFATRSTRPGAG